MKVLQYIYKYLWAYLVFTLGICIAWMFRESITSIFFYQNAFGGRSLVVQIGILVFSGILIATILVAILTGIELLASPLRGGKTFLLESIEKIGTRFEILCALIAANYCMVYFIFGETIPFFDGRGWDGVLYTNIVQNFSFDYISGFQHYYISRVFPSTIIYFFLTILKQPLTILNIIAGFRIFNSFILISGAFIWGKLTKELRISKSGRWLCLIGLLINFCVLKMYFYYPVLTDQSALILGIIQLYFYLKKKPFALFIVAVMGAFTWPDFFIGSLVLLAFPIQDKVTLVKGNNKISRTLAFIVSFLVLSLIIYFTCFDTTSLRFELVQIIYPLLSISMASVVLLIFVGINELIHHRNLLDFKSIRQELNIKWLIIGLVGFIFIQLFIQFIGKPGSMTLYTSLRLLFQISVVRPFNSLVSHFVYFGPLIIISLLSWKKISKTINQYGFGLVLFFSYYLIQSIIIAESRQITPFFPALVAFTIKSVDDLEWDNSKLLIFGAVSLIVSRIWLPINGQRFFGPMIEFPYQYYFMNLGPWMSNSMFFVFAVSMAITGILFYFILLKSGKNSTVSEE